MWRLRWSWEWENILGGAGAWSPRTKLISRSIVVCFGDSFSQKNYQDFIRFFQRFNLTVQINESERKLTTSQLWRSLYITSSQLWRSLNITTSQLWKSLYITTSLLWRSLYITTSQLWKSLYITISQLWRSLYLTFVTLV